MTRITLKSRRELERMRAAGRIVAEVLALLREKIAPGVTTAELDALADAYIRKQGAIPSFKGYPGGRGRSDFPASICASIDEEIVHGIPRPDRVLQEGQIISIDVGAIYKGFHGDAAITVAVGKVAPEVQRLVETTEGALWAGIAQAKVGNRTRDISRAIQQYAESRGYNVVREYTGHGIGREMHEPPQIPNFVQSGPWPVLKPGMTFALEPMLNQGDWHTRLLGDKWTVVPLDGKLSAHFEHTLVVTNGEAEILTEL